MAPVLIIHTGEATETLRERFGGYARQLQQVAGLSDAETEIACVFRGEMPREANSYRAALITGSPAMVTDREAWSEQTADWLRNAAEQGLPMFGVCYGHQLLAHALGGEVGYNPLGRALGTQALEKSPAATTDSLLEPLPERFTAQMLHAQVVTVPPPGATVLASSAMDPNQMLRIGSNIYSTQFHPEFSADFIRAHLDHYRDFYGKQGANIDAVLSETLDTAQAASLVKRFLQLCARDQA